MIALLGTVCRRVIGDTTPLTARFYCLEDFGRAPPSLHEMARRDYDVLVLCEPDFDLVHVDTRRDAAFRRRQHDGYLDRLAAAGERVLRVGGPLGRRLPHRHRSPPRRSDLFARRAMQPGLSSLANVAGDRVYAALVLPMRTRLLAIGLLIHIGLDGVDCLRMGTACC